MCKIEEILSTPLDKYEAPYYTKYDKGVKKIFQKKIFPQLLTLWSNTQKWFMIYRQFDIDTNPLIDNALYKVLFYVYKTDKLIIAERKEIQRQMRSKHRKLTKLRTRKMLYRS